MKTMFECYLSEILALSRSTIAIRLQQRGIEVRMQAGWTTSFHDKEEKVTKALKASALLAVTASLGCVTLPIAATVVNQPGRRVTAEASKFNIFGVTPLPVETASLLLDDLVEQCNGADLTGVTVGTETGFAVIGQTEKVIVSGYCVEPGR